MNFSVYWQKILRRNPALQDLEGNVALTKREFRRALELAYISGFDDAEDAMRNKDFDFVRDVMGGSND